jgi:hypothetical protein
MFTCKLKDGVQWYAAQLLLQPSKWWELCIQLVPQQLGKHWDSTTAHCIQSNLSQSLLQRPTSRQRVSSQLSWERMHGTGAARDIHHVAHSVIIGRETKQSTQHVLTCKDGCVYK